MKNLLCAIFLLTLLSCGERKEETVNDLYPMPWREASSQEIPAITRILIKNNVSGCGDYYVRPAKDSDGAFMVGCTSDGENWNYWVIYAYSGVVESLAFNQTPIEEPPFYSNE